MRCVASVIWLTVGCPDIPCAGDSRLAVDLGRGYRIYQDCEPNISPGCLQTILLSSHSRQQTYRIATVPNSPGNVLVFDSHYHRGGCRLLCRCSGRLLFHLPHFLCHLNKMTALQISTKRLYCAPGGSYSIGGYRELFND